MKKIALFVLGLTIFLSCQEESSLTFTESNFTSEELAIVDINIPKIHGASNVVDNMNTIIESFVANAIRQSEDVNKTANIKDAVSAFNNDYATFSKTLDESAQPWEAFVDGEVTLNTPEIMSIAINAYLNTGGAHGNSVISFLNFNPSTGETYSYDDVLDNLERVKPIFKEHFKNALIEEAGATESVKDVIFKMPETIGFSEDGVILVYNQHELEDYSIKLLEFTIPYSELGTFLNLDL